MLVNEPVTIKRRGGKEKIVFGRKTLGEKDDIIFDSGECKSVMGDGVVHLQTPYRIDILLTAG